MGSNYSNNSSCEKWETYIINNNNNNVLVLDMEEVSDDANIWQDLGYIPTINNIIICTTYIIII